MKKQTGISVVKIILVLMFSVVALIGASAYMKAAAKKQEVQRQQVEADKLHSERAKALSELQQLGSLSSEYSSAIQLASATSRIALAGPVQRLQDIHQRVKKAPVSNCAVTARTALDYQMSLVEQAFITFMSDSEALGKEISGLYFKDAVAKKEEYKSVAAACERVLTEAMSGDANKVPGTRGDK